MPKQRPPKLEAANGVEALVLEKTHGGLTGPHTFYSELRLNSAVKDMEEFFDRPEAMWPTKEVLVASPVTFPMGTQLVTDTTYRTTRVPMTHEEAMDYFRERVRNAAADAGVDPNSIPSLALPKKEETTRAPRGKSTNTSKSTGSSGRKSAKPVSAGKSSANGHPSSNKRGSK